MGTWGAGGFENDTAADFVAGLSSAEDIAAAFAALPDDPMMEIDADQAQTAIAAAECIAAGLGRPAPDMPETLEPTLAAFGEPDAGTIDMAKSAVSRVLRHSELTMLWAEDDPAEWNLAITSLIERLNPDLPYAAPKKRKKAEVRQTCSFCDAEIEPEQLFSFEIREQVDGPSPMSQGFWCHLKCLNARLHPKHIVLHWTFDPDAIERLAKKLLDC